MLFIMIFTVLTTVLVTLIILRHSKTLTLTKLILKCFLTINQAAFNYLDDVDTLDEVDTEVDKELDVDTLRGGKVFY